MPVSGTNLRENFLLTYLCGCLNISDSHGYFLLLNRHDNRDIVAYPCAAHVLSLFTNIFLLHLKTKRKLLIDVKEKENRYYNICITSLSKNLAYHNISFTWRFVFSKNVCQNNNISPIIGDYRYNIYNYIKTE